MKKLILIAGMVLAFASAREASARTLEIYTLDAPPLVIEQGDNHGIHGDVLLEAVKRAGFEAKLVFLPWRRGQDTVANGEDMLIIPLARTPEREPIYTWISNIYTVERTFATIDAPLDSIDQVKSKKATVLVGQGSAQEQLLLKNGVDKAQLQSQVIGKSEIEMLLSGRVNAWLNSTPETLWKWKQSGHKEKVFIGKAIASDDVYVACSKKCSTDITGPIGKAIDGMRQDGTIKKIIDKYLAGE
jgi:polar amino acid transport system substrate-binding protein